MKYRDRMGREYIKTTTQDQFLDTVYKSAPGRLLMKFLSLSVFSKAAHLVLSSKLSVNQ